MTTTRAEIGRRKRARTRATLVEAAMRVIARQGPDASSIDDVIAEAGVARGTFYNYFITTDDLLIAVATELSEQFFVEMAAIRNLPDPADRVASSVRSFIRKAVNDPTWGWTIVRIALLAAPIGTSMRDNLTADLEAGLSAGRFESPSLQAACDLVLGLGLLGMRTVLRGDAGAGHAEHIAELVLRALRVPDGVEVAGRAMDERSLAARSKRTSHRLSRPLISDPTDSVPSATRKCRRNE